MLLTFYSISSIVTSDYFLLPSFTFSCPPWSDLLPCFCPFRRSLFSCLLLYTTYHCSSLHIFCCYCPTMNYRVVLFFFLLYATVPSLIHVLFPCFHPFSPVLFFHLPRFSLLQLHLQSSFLATAYISPTPLSFPVHSCYHPVLPFAFLHNPVLLSHLLYLLVYSCHPLTPLGS